MAQGAYRNCVGVFDSGVGGISILKELVAELPCEDFLYFGDSAHAPYGEKTPEEVLSLSRGICDYLIGQGCKAIVVACNTATSAAVDALRSDYPEIPIVGVEPALKPAVLASGGDKVLVMATPMTVRLEKFQHLLEVWGSNAEVVSVSCEGLAGRIEQGNLGSDDVEELIASLVGAYAGKVDAVVLGCTHYPFVRRQIEAVLGDVEFFDSAQGTARQLRRRLEETGLIETRERTGTVSFESSKTNPEELELYRSMFEMSI